MARPAKSLLALLLIFITAGSLTNCTSLSTSDPVTNITIAVVEDDFGSVAEPDPQSVYAGVKLAADQMNARGYNVQVVAYADHNDVERAKEIAAEVANSDAIAVVGHSSVETSAAGAEIYDGKKLPVISVIPVPARLTQQHSHFFNITYTTETQAAYLANYLNKIKSRNTASVIFSDSLYNRTLTEKFANTFTGLGGEITFREELGPDAGDAELEEIVSNFVTADPHTRNPGAIFIAAGEETTRSLIVKIHEKGLPYPIVGGSNLTSAAFIEMMLRESEEQVQAGALTDVILTTSSVIFDSASRFAHQFLQDYRREYPQPEGINSPVNNNYNRSDPGNDVANGYDAARAILSAAQRTKLDGADVQGNRERVYEALLAMDSPSTGTQGIVGPLYFDPSRNAVGTARFGVYQNGQLISAMTQFEPVRSPELIKRDDLKKQLDSRRITTVNGRYVYVANVVHAGVDMIDIHDVDIKSSTYAMDFYLWFRYWANTDDPDFQPAAFVFTNAVNLDSSSMTPIREPETINGITTETYRVTGVFKNPFHFYEYPFDVQELKLQFCNKDATTSYIQYVVCFDNHRMVNAFRAVETIRPFLLADAATMDDTKGKESFLRGDSIMLFGGSWDMQYSSDRAKFSWSVFAAPAPYGGQTHIIFQPDAGIGINRATKNEAAARLFIEWLMDDGTELSEKYLPGRYPLINKAGEISSAAAVGHDADFAKLTTLYPSDIRWLFAETDSQYPLSSEIVRQALNDMITLKEYRNDAGETEMRYLAAAEAAQRLQSGLGEWYEPTQSCSR